MRKCEHRRKRKTFTHGRNSPPLVSCKDCGKVLSRNELKKEFENSRKNGRG